MRATAARRRRSSADRCAAAAPLIAAKLHQILTTADARSDPKLRKRRLGTIRHCARRIVASQSTRFVLTSICSLLYVVPPDFTRVDDA
jgi:hypothetical protein